MENKNKSAWTWILIVLFIVGLVILFAPQPYYQPQNSYCESYPPRVCQKKGWYFRPSFWDGLFGVPEEDSSKTIGELKFEAVNNYDLTDKVKGNKNYLVINSQDEWEKITIKPSKEKQESSKIDFEKDTVVVLAMGIRTSGGYKIETAKVIDWGDKVVVFAKETSPGKNCMVTLAIEFPYQIIRLAKISKPVSFEVEQVVRECD